MEHDKVTESTIDIKISVGAATDVGGRTENEDAILVRPMAYVTLTIDHRVVDGHQTNAWLTRFVEILENWPAA